MIDLKMYRSIYKDKILYTFKDITIDSVKLDENDLTVYYIHSLEDFLKNGQESMEIVELDRISEEDEGFIIDGVEYLMGSRTPQEYYDWVKPILDEAISKSNNSSKLFYYKEINPKLRFQ